MGGCQHLEPEGTTPGLTCVAVSTSIFTSSPSPFSPATVTLQADQVQRQGSQLANRSQPSAATP